MLERDSPGTHTWESEDPFLTRSRSSAGISIRISTHGFVRQKLIPVLRIGPDWSAGGEMP